MVPLWTSKRVRSRALPKILPLRRKINMMAERNSKVKLLIQSFGSSASIT